MSPKILTSRAPRSISTKRVKISRMALLRALTSMAQTPRTTTGCLLAGTLVSPWTAGGAAKPGDDGRLSSAALPMACDAAFPDGLLVCSDAAVGGGTEDDMLARRGMYESRKLSQIFRQSRPRLPAGPHTACFSRS